MEEEYLDSSSYLSEDASSAGKDRETSIPTENSDKSSAALDKESSIRAQNSETASIPRENSSDEEDLFAITFVAFTREFRGQRAGNQVNKFRVEAGSAKGFMEKLFRLLRPYVKREICFVDEKFSWSDAELSVDDMKR